MPTFFGLLVAATFSYTTFSVSAAEVTATSQVQEVAEIGTRYTIHSTILDEDRQILVRLPEGYSEGDKRYPVVYLTDAEDHFSYAVLMAGVLEGQARMPASIFVGITNAEGARGRDLRTEKDTFRRYIQDEVFAFISSNFRTTDLRTFYGGSLGGNFALDMLADNSDMFTNYIAASPASSAVEGELLKKFDDQFSANTKFSKSVYFTMTEKGEEGPRLTSFVNNIVELFESRVPKSLDWRYEFIAREVHMTTPIPTIYAGLSHVFRDFQSPTFNSSEEYETAGGMKGLEDHFTARAVKYGMEAGMPVDVRIMVGEIYSGEAKHTQALDMFSEAVKLFPEHRIAFSRLGGSYMALDMHENSLKAYKRALFLTDPQNSSAIDYYKARIAAMEAKLAE